MGLLNKLNSDGSNLSKYNGTTPLPNPLATKQSQLHGYGNEAGYSVDGAFAAGVGRQYHFNYDDGTPNAIPQPSQLDLHGQTPKIPGKYPYLDNLPK